MPPRNAFKTNASFFRMLALGAVGAQTVQQHLDELGHIVVELERGALSTKIWRDVKRKRVRIPDLCCTACGVRIESRAKTSPDLRMSHSTGDAERAWDYGMLDSDWIAFPVLSPVQNIWNAGPPSPLRRRRHRAPSSSCASFSRIDSSRPSCEARALGRLDATEPTKPQNVSSARSPTSVQGSAEKPLQHSRISARPISTRFWPGLATIRMTSRPDRLRRSVEFKPFQGLD